jgi:group II intron reverse transcriptase/maturase
LHAKAKGAPDYRFYVLYDKVYRADVLAFAYRCCRANGGAAGVDGQTFEDIESYGLDRWLGEVTEALREKTYRPQPIRRTYLPKPDGSQRPLGIPTIRDRVVQTATRLVIEPIFEADLPDEQYAYRAQRSALDAVNAVFRLVISGHQEVVDADLSGYFDTIPHAELMKSVARRISDRHLLHLIKMWLVAPVVEADERGRPRRATRAKDEGRGIPQGAPLSPLLANLYMRRFILAWKQRWEQRLDAHVVNYADDYVICCRGTGRQALAAMGQLMGRLKLTVNQGKTSLRCLPAESVDFLGYTLGWCYSKRRGRRQLGSKPSTKALARARREIRELTSPRWVRLPVETRVVALNRQLVGWANYFHLGSVWSAYLALDRHARGRLRHWLRRKHKVAGRGVARFPDRYLHQTLGLVRLTESIRNLPWANA